jgi:hypothetical protein
MPKYTKSLSFREDSRLIMTVDRYIAECRNRMQMRSGKYDYYRQLIDYAQDVKDRVMARIKSRS